MSIDSRIARVQQEFNSQDYCNTLAIHVLRLSKGASRVRMQFENRKLGNLQGVLHGGAIASLADSGAAVALLSLVEPDERIVTIEFKVNFFRPVTLGELFADAQIIHKGSRTAVAEVVITDQQHKLVAKSLATFMILREADQK